MTPILLVSSMCRGRGTTRAHDSKMNRRCGIRTEKKEGSGEQMGAGEGTGEEEEGGRVGR